MKGMNRATAASSVDTAVESTEPPILKQCHAKAYHPYALTNFDVMPDSAYVRLPVVTKLFGVSRATVWRWSKMGKITATRLSEKTTGWNVGNLRRALKGAA